MRCLIDVNANPSNSDPKYSFEMPFLLPFFNATFTKKPSPWHPPDGAALWAMGAPYDSANLRCPAPPPPKGHVALDAPGAKMACQGGPCFFWLRTSKNWINRGIFLETKNWGIK